MEKKKPTRKAVKKAAVKKTAAKKIVSKKGVKKAQSSTKKVVARKIAKKTTGAKSQAGITERATEKAVSKKAEPARISGQEMPLHSETMPSSPSVETSSLPGESRAEVCSLWQDRYEDNRIVLMIRDPYWCFVYWDLSTERQAEIIREIQTAGVRVILRVYDVTDIEFDGSNAHRTMDIEITEEATNWYINVWAADRSYCVDLGLLYPDGRFVTFARSNVVTTPRDSVSPVVDEEWMVVDETFDRLYQSAGAAEPGSSSEAITKYMLKRVRADVSSGGLASMGSEGGRPKPARREDFWLVVNTELIVYGATEPDATVTIQGQPLKLNQDGTFSVRYALPDGKQAIPVRAVNAGGTQERKITPVVEKHTE